MSHASVFAAGVFLSCASLAALQAQDAAKGAALLGEARTALGGEARLAAVKALDVRGAFKRLAGQTTIEGELQIRLERPDRWRRDEDLSPPGGGPSIVRTEVVNGATVWEENTGRGGFFVAGGVPRGGGGGRGGGFGDGRRDADRQGDTGRGAAPDPAQLEAAQRRAWQAELARFLLVWLLATDGQVAWAGTAQAPEGQADVLEIAPGAGPATRLFLDQQSHLPLMITWQGAAPQMFVRGRGGRADAGPPPAARGGQQATLQMTLGDYKTVNGIRVPHFITRGANDMTTEEWTIDSYRINPNFGRGVFVK